MENNNKNDEGSYLTVFVVLTFISFIVIEILKQFNSFYEERQLRKNEEENKRKVLLEKMRRKNNSQVVSK